MRSVKWYLVCLALVVVASAALAEPKKRADSIAITGGKVTASGPTTTVEKGELTAIIGENVAKIKADSSVLNFAQADPVRPLKTADLSGNVSLVAQLKAKNVVCVGSSIIVVMAKDEDDTKQQTNEMELKITAKKASIDWSAKTITLDEAKGMTIMQMEARPDGARDGVTTTIGGASWVIRFTEEDVVLNGVNIQTKPDSKTDAK